MTDMWSLRRANDGPHRLMQRVQGTRSFPVDNEVLTPCGGTKSEGDGGPLDPPLALTPGLWTQASVKAGTRGENDRKQSVNTKTIFVFIFFLGNEIENVNSGNKNDIGNSETSETKVWYENYTGYDQNLKFDR
jgi:hypothetical protein